MKTAIVYSTTHGTTEKVATMISELAQSETELINLKKVKNVDLSAYDRVVIGGSIHAGKIQNNIQDFCKSHMQELTVKPLGLFMSCMDEEKSQLQFDTAFPEELRKHAVTAKVTGGEFNFDRMNFMEKFLVKRIAGVKESVSKINKQKVEELVKEMGLHN